MASYKELLEQRAALEKQIAEVRQREKEDAIREVRAIVAQYELHADDVFKNKAARAKKGAAKFRDPVSGKTWTGKGKAPAWIAGQDRLKFVIV